jgi:hypothetical protein
MLTALEVTEPAGTAALAVSPTVTVRLLKGPPLPTVVAWHFPLLLEVGQLKPDGKLFGVKVYPPKPGVLGGTV